MTSIEKHPLNYNIKLFSLHNYDHVYVVPNFNKQTLSSTDSSELRIILEQYIDKKDMDFIFSAHGRPYLSPSLGQTPLFFSLAHSQHSLVVAISLDEQIGIDIEEKKPRAFKEAIAERYFHAPTPLTLLDFYRHWTARESYIKALGGSLFKDMGSIKVEDSGNFLIGQQTHTHSVSFFEPQQGFIAAVCRPCSTHKDITFFVPEPLINPQSIRAS